MTTVEAIPEADKAGLEANKAVPRRWGELADQGRIDELDEVATADCLIHYPGGVEVRGIEAIKESARHSAAAFSEPRHEFGIQVAEGDLVASRFLFIAKHTGDYHGAAPRAKRSPSR
jgi:predicted ester cyclase